MALDLTKKSELSRPLYHSEVDANWTAIEEYCVEEKIIGTFGYASSVSGSTNLSLSSETGRAMIMTGNTTFTFTNLISNGETVVKSWLVKGEYTISFTQSPTIIGSYDDGTKWYVMTGRFFYFNSTLRILLTFEETELS